MATNYAPKVSQTFTTTGAIRNISDGINSDGSLNTRSQAAAPRLLATVAFSSFTTASTTLNVKIAATLTRYAKERTFTVYTTLNQPFSANQVGVYLFDSTIASPTAPPAGPVIQNFGGTSLANGAWAMGVSEQYPYLAAHVDSLFVALPIGATLPTSGNVYVYVTELL